MTPSRKSKRLSIEISLPAQGVRVWPDRLGMELEVYEKYSLLPQDEDSTAAEALRAWHYLQHDRKRIGPVSQERIFELLQEGTLDGQSLVWAKGRAQWSAASSVPELQSMLEEVPPPVPLPELVLSSGPPPLPEPERSEPVAWPDHGFPWNPKIDYGVFSDPRDGRRYRTIRIGKQTWFSENLAFRALGSWVYGNDLHNESKYGRLYEWETAKGAVPPGWHLPSDEEWMELERAVGMDLEVLRENGWRATSGEGYRLKACKGWPTGKETDAFGFRILPAGWGDHGAFKDLGNYATFWTATPSGPSTAIRRALFFDDGYLDRSAFDRACGFSLRCVQD